MLPMSCQAAMSAAAGHGSKALDGTVHVSPVPATSPSGGTLTAKVPALSGPDAPICTHGAALGTCVVEPADASRCPSPRASTLARTASFDRASHTTRALGGTETRDHLGLHPPHSPGSGPNVSRVSRDARPRVPVRASSGPSVLDSPCVSPGVHLPDDSPTQAPPRPPGTVLTCRATDVLLFPHATTVPGSGPPASLAGPPRTLALIPASPVAGAMAAVPMRQRTWKEARERAFKRAWPTMESFEFVRDLGSGSFGEVLLVWHPPSRRHYALKVVDKAAAIAARATRALRDERRALLAADSPFVVDLIATYQTPRSVFFLMEALVGGEVFEHPTRVPPFRFPEEAARAVAAPVALALRHLHSRGIVYRDLKPENLVLDDRGRPKIVDMGYAVVAGSKPLRGVAGTFEYMAPEMIAMRDHGAPADVWAFGVLLYELLSGKTPFASDGPEHDPARAVMTGHAEFPSYFSKAARDLIGLLLRRDPAMRIRCKAQPQLSVVWEDIMRHPWFDGVAWDELASGPVQDDACVPTGAAGGDEDPAARARLAERLRGIESAAAARENSSDEMLDRESDKCLFGDF